MKTDVRMRLMGTNEYVQNVHEENKNNYNEIILSMAFCRNEDVLIPVLPACVT